MDDKKTGGNTIILIAHALVWAAAMLGGSWALAGRPWSEDLVLWMVVGFMVSNGLLMAALGRRPRC